MPSRIEGLPLVLIEAMLCGRPVVATDVAGAEVIEDEVTGFLAGADRRLGGEALAIWGKREDAKEIGATAAGRVRHLIPPDPARLFVDAIRKLSTS